MCSIGVVLVTDDFCDGMDDFVFFFLMIRRTPRSKRTDTLFPYPTLFRSVIVPGMLVMAQLGKMLTDWAGPSSVRRWNVRFTNIAPVLATPTYFAEVQEQTNVDGEPCLRLALWVVAEGVGEVVRGEALIAIQPD